MGMFTDQRVKARKLRQSRVRNKLRGTADRPRLSVFRSDKHIYVQVISDDTGETLNVSTPDHVLVNRLLTKRALDYITYRGGVARHGRGVCCILERSELEQRVFVDEIIEFARA